MYDEEKNLYSHLLAGASELADQKRVATANQPKGKWQLIRHRYWKILRWSLGTEKVLETSKTQAERSEEKLTTNQIPEISNLTEAIQSQMQIPIESREVDEEGLRRR